jgi:hypothetical protein
MNTPLTVIDNPWPGKGLHAYVFADEADKPPVGSCWRYPKGDEPDRECWFIVLPNNAGIWQTTLKTPASGYWKLTGEMPNITVTPSISRWTHDHRLWHGWITNGELVEVS